MWLEHMGWLDALRGLWRALAGAVGAFLLILCLAGLMSASAWPRMHAGPGVMDGGRRLGGSPVAPPLDGMVVPTGAYSFRKLRTAYAGSAIRVRRASDNAELDIGFLGFVPGLGSPWDVAAATAHCAATSCFGTKWYDQSGAARDIFHATPASQPALIFDCIGALPCLATTVASQALITAATVTPATGIVSLNAVARQVGGSGNCTLFRQNGGNNRITTTTTAGQWLLQAAAVNVHQFTAAAGLWHSVVGIIAGASSSIINIDGTETANATGGTNVVAGTAGIVGGTTTCQWAEAVVWDNYVLSAGERAVLVNNQRSFWRF